MKKEIISLVMAVCMAASLSACSGGQTQANDNTAVAEGTTSATDTGSSEGSEAETEGTKAASGKPLVMATNAEFPPYEFHDGGDIVGIDVEIARAIAAEMGRELKVEDMAFDSIIPAVQSGKADFGAAGMTVDEDRKKNVDFSDTYAQASQVIIVREDSEIASKDDLAGKVIGVQLGTTGDIYVEDVGAKSVERYNKGFEAVQALSKEKIDAVVIDGEPAKVFVQQNEGLKLLDEALTVEEYAICVKKGNTELTEGINEAIAKLKESGELQKIIDKYITAE